MMIFAIDTRSLIALQYSGYLSTIDETVDIVITKKIHSELEEIGKFTDNDAAATREILKLLHTITIMEVSQRLTGEEELIEVALQKKCNFSTSLIFTPILFNLGQPKPLYRSPSQPYGSKTTTLHLYSNN